MTDLALHDNEFRKLVEELQATGDAVILGGIDAVHHEGYRMGECF